MMLRLVRHEFYEIDYDFHKHPREHKEKEEKEEKKLEI